MPKYCLRTFSNQQLGIKVYTKLISLMEIELKILLYPEMLLSQLQWTNTIAFIHLLGHLLIEGIKMKLASF
jgi:hypothetical protein